MSLSSSTVFGKLHYNANTGYDFMQAGWWYAMQLCAAACLEAWRGFDEDNANRFMTQNAASYRPIQHANGQLGWDDIVSLDDGKFQEKMTDVGGHENAAVARLGWAAALLRWMRLTKPGDGGIFTRNMVHNALDRVHHVDIGNVDRCIRLLESLEADSPGRLSKGLLALQTGNASVNVEEPPPAPTPQRSRGTARRSLTILLVIAEPSSLPPLALAEEVRIIDRIIRTTEFRDSVTIHPLLAARASDISGGLLRYKPNIIHFSGHGSADGALALQTETQAYQLVSPEALAKLLALGRPNLWGVVLNACYSNEARQVAETVPHLIAMNGAVDNEAAVVFSRGFYEALGYGETFEVAFQWGEAAVALDNRAHLLKAQLYSNSQ